MIKEIFLPERIGNRRIIAQRIIGVSLQDDAVYAVQIYAKYSQTFIENICSESYEPGNQESLVQALIALKAKFGRYDRITVALPASIVVIKELEVPFVDAEKIRMVLDYEIESMLPFAVDEAVLDFIITESLPSQGSSFILAAAVRMQDLQNSLELYARAGIDPSVVTVDLFSFYSLYQQIADYQAIKNGSAFVDLGLFTTRISFIQNGKLRMTRQIPRGLMTIVNAITKESTETPEEILNTIKTLGIANAHEQGENLAIQKQVINFFNDIQFTLNSFSLKANYYEGITKILFTGKSVDINGFMRFSSNLLQIPCEIFDVPKFFDYTPIENMIKTLPSQWSHYAASLGAAIPSSMLIDFNVRRKNFAPAHHQIVWRQVLAAGMLVMMILGLTGVMGYMQISALKKQIFKTEQQHKRKLNPLLPEKDRSKKTTLQSLVNNAKKIVKEKEELLLPVMQERTNPLQLLYELTELIDQKKNNLIIEEVLIEEHGQGKQAIEVEGYFKSDRAQWEDWTEVKKRFKESLHLSFVGEIDDKNAAEKGIKFKAKLQLKEITDTEA